MFGFFRKRKTDEYVEKTTTEVPISEIPDWILSAMLENDGMSDKMRKELLKELDDRRKNKEHV